MRPFSSRYDVRCSATLSLQKSPAKTGANLRHMQRDARLHHLGTRPLLTRRGSKGLDQDVLGTPAAIEACRGASRGRKAPDTMERRSPGMNLRGMPG